jgi:4-carboxymuconolactone decarboxylase
MSKTFVPSASSGSDRSATIKPEATDFGTFGRFEETSVGEMPVAMKEAYDFTMKLRGLVPGPHKIWLANPELSKTVVPIGAYYQKRSTLTKPEIEIATNLVNGRWLAAYSNYEHEIIGEAAGGLPPEKVEALIAGLPTSFDDPRQQVVYELASTLIAPRVVPKGLYRRAKALLGDAGIVDVTMLLGWFTGVSLTLMAFDVPSNAIGLEQ